MPKAPYNVGRFAFNWYANCNNGNTMPATQVFMVVNLSITDAESYRNYEKAAKNWYADGDYQARSEHRRAGTKLEFRTLVHGMPERD